MTRDRSRPDPDSRLFHKLAESPFFQTYRQAFNDATGLDLLLLPGDRDEACRAMVGRFSNDFCRRLNSAGESCRRCTEAHRELFDAASERADTVTCFAGLRETAVPVRSGGRTVALLSVGRVFTADADDAPPAAVEETLDEMGVDDAEAEVIRDAWSAGPVMGREQYQGAITLLAAFALQLSEVLNRMMVEESNAEPEVVVNAKRFVNAHLEDKISLEQVARHVGVSSYYFCKLFKQSTGMTLTEYVNRRRVEWAKRRLLNPQSRVTEVAFDVGFQSISQFNRSFLKYVGESPTRFREKKEANTSLSAAAAA